MGLGLLITCFWPFSAPAHGTFCTPNRWGLGFPSNFFLITGGNDVLSSTTIYYFDLASAVNSSQLQFTPDAKGLLDKPWPRILLAASSYTVATKKSTSSIGSLATNNDLKKTNFHKNGMTGNRFFPSPEHKTGGDVL